VPVTVAVGGIGCVLLLFALLRRVDDAVLLNGGHGWFPGERGGYLDTIGHDHVFTTKDDATSGVDVVTVVAGGPAAKAGIQPGWVITAVGGQSVADSSALSQALTAYSPGNQVSVTVRLPDGSTRTVTVTLGERPVTP